MAMGEATSWEELEFQMIDLGDKRLDKRFRSTFANLSAKPSASINQACGSWSDTKGAYRLFDNEKVTADKILQPHQQRTLARVRAEKTVLAVQDTTSLNYTHHESKTGLGSIGSNANKRYEGLLIHSTLAITPEGLSLGLIDQNIYARTRCIKSISNKKLPFKEKESYRWFEAMQVTHQLDVGSTRVVTVADRESDIYELFHFGQGANAEFLVRASQDRRLDQGRPSATKYLWDHMEKQPVLGCIDIEVPAEKTTSRVASVSLRAASIKLKCPYRKGERLSDVELYAVWLREGRPPREEQGLEWMLLTNIPCLTAEDVMEKIGWYKARWQIEIYHKVLKSGCTVEDCRLEDTARLIPYLTMMSIIAWRLHWMTYIHRAAPESPCDIVFASYEWKALYIKVNKTRSLPREVPTVREAVLLMSQLGGFLNRKRDGHPGITAIWRGWARLKDIAEDYLLFTGGSCG